MTTVANAYQPLPPELKYHISQNERYLLEILPCSKQSAEDTKHGLQRNALTIVIYEKEDILIGETKVYYWQEQTFFRVKHPDSVANTLAEAIQGVISNDGNCIVILSQVNPMARIHPVDDIHVYDRSGNLLKSFSQEEIFKNQIKDVLSISIDEKKYQIKAVSVEGETKYISLKTFKIK